MKAPLERSFDAEELRTMLADCFTVGETRPVIELEGAAGRTVYVSVDFPVPCEPRSQTSMCLSLAEALQACRCFGA